MIDFDIVVAADEANGIGRAGDLVWRLPGDTKFLKRLTSQTQDADKRNAVLMGRKTWESIPAKYRPLKKRLNAVVTRQSSYQVPEGVLCHNGIAASLDGIAGMGGIERVFVLGGGEIYRISIALPACRRIYLTRVEGRFECDALFPEISENFRLVDESERHEENDIGYRFQIWQRAE
jgi:dihydrofolate reductase/thymidylate synthase